MSSMGSLSTAMTGLRSNQTALNTTAHNLSNVNTSGYVRQQVVMKDNFYVNIGSMSSMQVGTGSSIECIRQVRDSFLDAAYREENSKLLFYQVNEIAIAEVEGIFGEFSGVGFSGTLEEMWVALNELSKNPDSMEARGLFVQSAVAFVDRSNLIMEQLQDYQINLDMQIRDMVDDINAIATEIDRLNDLIVKYEMAGDSANDLRDQRNLLIDELSQYVNVIVREDASGRVDVFIEGQALVADGIVNEIILEPVSEGNSFVKPVWKNNGEDVINPNSSSDNGALRAKLQARGTGPAYYTDTLDKEHYENNIADSIVMSTMAKFDKLVHNVVTLVNDIVAPIGGDGPYGLDGSQGVEIFTRKHYDRYDEDGNYIPEDPNDPTTYYSAGNIEVNPEVLKDYNKLCLSVNPDDISDNTVVEEIIKGWSDPSISLDPESDVLYNINDYYAAFINEIGNAGMAANNMRSNQYLMVSQIQNQRQQLMGVSSDEELGNMIKYQYAYTASARMVNVIDEMIETVIHIGR